MRRAHRGRRPSPRPVPVRHRSLSAVPRRALLRARRVRRVPMRAHRSRLSIRPIGRHRDTPRQQGRRTSRPPTPAPLRPGLPPHPTRLLRRDRGRPLLGPSRRGLPIQGPRARRDPASRRMRRTRRMVRPGHLRRRITDTGRLGAWRPCGIARRTCVTSIAACSARRSSRRPWRSC